jgi:CHAT domain-containing protein
MLLLAAEEKEGGGESRGALDALAGLADVQGALGDLAGRRDSLERAARGWAAVSGAEAPAALEAQDALAGVRRALGDLAGAREIHERILAARAAAAAQGSPEAARAMTELARDLHAQGDLAGAKALLERALSSLGEAEESAAGGLLSLEAAYAASELSSVEEDMGALAQARALGSRALAALEALGLESPAACNNQADVLLELGDLEGAFGLTAKALAGAATVRGGNDPETFRAMNRMGTILREAGDLMGGLEYSARAFEERARVLGPEHPDTLQSEANMAVALRDVGDLGGAREAQLKNHDVLSRALGPGHPLTVMAAIQLAVTDLAYGETEAAREALTETLETAVRLHGADHPLAATCEALLGKAYDLLGDPEASIRYLTMSVNATQRARAALSSLPRELRRSHLETVKYRYQSLVDVLMKAGRVPEALAVTDLMKDDELRELGAGGAGRAPSAMGPSAAAPAEWLRSGASRAGAFAGTSGEAASIGAPGPEPASAEAKGAGAAEAVSWKGAAAGAAAPEPASAEVPGEGAAVAVSWKGAAAGAAGSGAALAEAAGEGAAAAAAEGEASGEGATAGKGAAAGAAGEGASAGAAGEGAAAGSEASGEGAAAVSSGGEAAPADAAGGGAGAETEAAMGAELAALLEKLGRDEISDAELDRMDELREKVEVSQREFHRIAESFREVLGGEEGEAAAQAAKLLQSKQETLLAMGGGTVLVHAVSAEETLYLMLVTPNALVARSAQIRREDLERLAQEFRGILTSPHKDPRQAGKLLWDAVMAPLTDQLEGAGAKTLMFSLDGALRYVPMAALWDGERYLAERWPSALFTLSTVDKLRDGPPEGPAEARALGVTQGFPEFPPLSGVAEEIASILGKEGEAGAVLAGEARLDADFTRRALMRSLASPAPVVHVASHFKLDPASHDNTVLLLGDGNTLSLRAISEDPTLDFKGLDLLTLSACDTGSGARRSSGKEVESFGEVVQDRGAAAVLASLWQVHDLSTAELMREFYRLRYLEGLDKARALQGAQLKVMRDVEAAAAPGRGVLSAMGGAAAAAAEAAPAWAGKGYSHPYYWSSFIVMGNWR